VWNTTGWEKANYQISVTADTHPAEWLTQDNTYNDGTIAVVHPGDINGDGVVDIFGCVTVALAFASIPSDPNWNPSADINNDGIVDIFDIVVVALHFGEVDP